MNVIAGGAHEIRRLAIRPIKLEEGRSACIQQRVALVKLVIPADYAKQLLTGCHLNFNGSVR
jgi:hypothetical protein